MAEPRISVGESAGLKVERDRGCVTITLSRPESRNSLTTEMIAGTVRALGEAERDRSTFAIVLTGAGDRSFCSGADLKNLDLFKHDHGTTSTAYANLARALHDAQLPVIARVNGSATAGGVGILGLCDFVIATEQAKFGIPEINVGFFPSMVVSALQQKIPRFDLIELCMLGQLVSADDALRMGLVSRIVPAQELDQAVDAVVDALRAKPISVLRRGKYMLRATESMSFEQSIAFMETMLRAQASDPSATEGLSAFREKRPPNWPTGPQ